VTIAGAGVFGVTTALALADAGLRVTVCDPDGANASAVAAGMIAPVFEAVLDETARPHLDLLTAARDRWPTLESRTGVPLDRSGALAVGSDDWLEGLLRTFSALHVRPAELGAAPAMALAPGLAAPRRALLTREDWRVDAPSGLARLRAAAADAGVTFERRAVRRREGDLLVIATGAHTGLADLAPELAQLSPIKGHIVRVAAAAVGAVVRGQGVYAVPGAAMAFGATMEAGRNDDAVDPAQVAPLLDRGLQLFPGLVGVPSEAATGVRAATPDGLPLAGFSAAPGVLLATGARRNGWLLAPLVAQVVTACVTGREAGPYAPRMAPARFGG
jgi:glycine oxidase